MTVEIRDLHTPEELKDVVRLEQVVGGLPPLDVTSPITLTAMSVRRPRTGFVLGAFQDGRMIGFCLALATLEPGLIYGHMLGVDPACRDAGAGLKMLTSINDHFREAGIKKSCWTYEPLEARNAHLYLNKQNARCVHYDIKHFHLQVGIHAGLPQDRFLAELVLAEEADVSPQLESLDRALGKYPVVNPDFLPDEATVLTEIPSDIHGLLDADQAAALKWRLDSRAVFLHYINEKGYAADRFYSGRIDGERRGFYCLTKT